MAKIGSWPHVPAVRRKIASGLDPADPIGWTQNLTVIKDAVNALYDAYPILPVASPDFYYHTQFDSLDAFTTALSGTGAITRDFNGLVTMQTGTTSGSSAWLSRTFLYSAGAAISGWSKSREFALAIQCSNWADLKLYLNWGSRFGWYIGFLVENNNLYGVGMYDSTTKAKVLLVEGLTSGMYALRFDHTKDVCVDYYVNGVLAGTTETGFPKAITADSTRVFDATLLNTAAVDRSVKLADLRLLLKNE